MTKTFTEKGIEYLLVEVPKDANNCFYDYFGDDLKCGSVYYDDANGDQFGGDTLMSNYEDISLLKDITEEQAKEISSEVIVVYKDGNSYDLSYKDGLFDLLESESIDTSLNWLLLKKI
jgi:hypothetical protein